MAVALTRHWLNAGLIWAGKGSIASSLAPSRLPPLNVSNPQVCPRRDPTPAVADLTLSPRRVWTIVAR
jgi:hypothetical protein